MPQLKLETFVTQYFWLIVILFVFYFIIYSYVIPRMTSLDLTRQRLQSNLSTLDVVKGGTSSFDLKVLHSSPSKSVKSFEHVAHNWASNFPQG